MKKIHRVIGVLLLAIMLGGCQSLEPIRTAEDVDLDRFAGDWYVIASIPTFIETEAYNAIETYAPPEDGVVATTFTFLDGGFDGPRKTYNPTGFVSEESTAVWGMQFVWPIKAEYRILYVDEDYEQTIIGRRARDYVWIMARSPELSPSEYDALVSMIETEGYDVSKLRKVPHAY